MCGTLIIPLRAAKSKNILVFFSLFFLREGTFLSKSKAHHPFVNPNASFYVLLEVMMDAPGSDSEWTQKGLRTVTLRIIAESKFSIMYAISLLQQLGTARKLQDRFGCEKTNLGCATDVMSEACVALATCRFAKDKKLVNPGNPLLAFDPSGPDMNFIIVTLLLLVVNISVSVFCLLEVSEEKKWRQSDVALCFKLNVYYERNEWVKWIKTAMLFIYLIAVGLILWNAYADDMLLNVATAQILPSITAAIALTSLHTPAAELKSVPFSVYKRALDGQTFGLADLASSAPTLLLQKLTAAALEDVQEESHMST